MPFDLPLSLLFGRRQEQVGLRGRSRPDLDEVSMLFVTSLM